MLYLYVLLYFSIFPPKQDLYISGPIAAGGIYESHLLVLIMKALDNYPGALFINLGANLGVWTLFAAAMGHNVIAGRCIH